MIFHGTQLSIPFFIFFEKKDKATREFLYFSISL